MQDFQKRADEAFADLLHRHDIEKRPPAPSVPRREASKKARRGE
jgi:hypothetical protein